MAWHDDFENVKQWHNAAREAAVVQRILKEEGRPEDFTDDRSYMNLYSQFAEEVGAMDTHESGRDMLIEWSSWLTGADVEPAREAQLFHATITKHYGSVSVTFGYEARFDVAKRQSKGAYLYCLGMVNQQFEQFERNGLPQSKPPVQRETPTETGDTVYFISESLEVEIKDGKRYYKIRGAQYTRFGIRVWPEVLKASGIDPDEFEVGPNHFVRECAAFLQDGKVRKVVSIK